MTVGLRLDPEDPTPPYEQLRRQLSDVIQSGTLAPRLDCRRSDNWQRISGWPLGQ